MQSQGSGNNNTGFSFQNFIKPVKLYGQGSFDQAQVVGSYDDAITVSRGGQKKYDKIIFRQRDPEIAQKIKQNSLAYADDWWQRGGDYGVSTSLQPQLANEFAQTMKAASVSGYEIAANQAATRFVMQKADRRQAYLAYKLDPSRDNATYLQAVIATQILNLLSRYGQLQMNDPGVVAQNRKNTSQAYKDYTQKKSTLQKLELNRQKDLKKFQITQALDDRRNTSFNILNNLVQNGIQTQDQFKSAVGAAGKLYGTNAAQLSFNA